MRAHVCEGRIDKIAAVRYPQTSSQKAIILKEAQEINSITHNALTARLFYPDTILMQVQQ